MRPKLKLTIRIIYRGLNPWDKVLYTSKPEIRWDVFERRYFKMYTMTTHFVRKEITNIPIPLQRLYRNLTQYLIKNW